ncbi:MAG: hypothetical protein OMM_09610, partial [Candidatus Magnetoglobus multicellularis str. Araruama]
NGYVLRCGNNGTINLAIGNSSVWYYATSGAIMSVNTWHHVAATFNGTTLKIYLDGTEVQSASPTNAALGYNGTEQFKIGDSYGFPGRYFHGSMDEIRIWNVARSQADIQSTRYQMLTGNESGLVGYWRFDQDSVTSVYDTTHYLNHGTFTNMDVSDWVDSSFSYSITTNEDVPFTILAGYDLDGDSITITTVSAPSNGTLIFDNANEVITYTPNENYYGSDQFTYQLTDGSNSDSFTVLVNVSSVNDSPSVSNISDQTTNEDTAILSISLTATDDETTGCSLGITYASSNTNLVSIDSISYTCDSGVYYISLTPTANQSGSTFITVTVTDEGNSSSSSSFALTVNSVNDAPVIGSIADQEINKNESISSLSLTATDVETAVCSLGITFGSSNTSLISVDHIAYTCDSSNIYISLTPTTDQTGISTLSITMTDAGNLTASTSFAITVIDTNTAPLIGLIDNQTTNKNTSISSISLTATDNETATCSLNITFASSNQNLISGNNISYTCDSGGFTLSLTPLTAQSGFATITVTINDPQGLTALSSFDLTVLNQSPVAGSGSYTSQTINEDTTFTMTAGYDPDGDSLTITSLSGPSNGTLSFDHTNVVITYTPTANYSGADQFTYQLSDGTDYVSYTVSVTITDINDPPIIGSVNNQACAVNTTISSISLTATDFETAICSLNITFTSSNTTLIPVENITYTCDTNGFDFDIAPVSSQSGNSTISITITDAGGLFSTTSFDVLVSTAPTISSISDQNTAAGTIDFICSDNEAGLITVTATSSDQTVLPNSGIKLTGSDSNTTTYNGIAGESQNLTLTMTPNANQHNRVTITITVTDAAGLNDSTIFTVIVSPPGSGNALSFDGTDEYINLGTINSSHPLALAGSNFTFSLWIKPTLSGDVDQKIINKNDGYYGKNGYSLQVEPGGLLGLQIDGTILKPYIAKTATGVLVANQWQHIAMTGDGSSYKCYINGVNVSLTTNDYQAPPSANAELWIGKYTGSNKAYNGSLDEVRIWNRALSQTEIQQNMCKRLSGNESGLLLYYRLDHTSGTTVKDLSGNGYNGTLTNMESGDWELSGASLGDDSIYDYSCVITSNCNPTLSHSNGDTFHVTGASGAFESMHLYVVNGTPNATVSYSGYQDDDHYWGVFIDGSSTTYDIEYNYQNHELIPNTADLRFYSRTGNTDTSWSHTSKSNDTINKILTKTGVSGTNKEFVFLINNYPQLSTVDDQFIDMDTSIISIPITITDAETAGCSLDITYSSSNTSLVLTNNISYTCANNIYYFSLTPTTSEAGNAVITIDATDSGNKSSSMSFTINVNAPPEIGIISDQITSEDTAILSIPITVNDQGASGCDLGLTIVSSNTSLLPSENISYTCVSDTFYYSLTPTANLSGNTTIQITVIDDRGLTASTSFALTVNAVNDPPEIGSIADQSTFDNVAILSIPLTASDIETAGCSLNITFASTDINLISVESISYTCDSGIFYISLSPTTDQIGNATISVIVTDTENLTASTSFALTVNLSNNPPLLGSINNQATNEDSAIHSIQLTATDNETATCSLGITYSSSNTNLISMENISYTCDSDGFYFSLTPTADLYGTSSISITVTDAGNLTATSSFELTVLSVNDPPTVSNELIDQSATEDTSFTYTFTSDSFSETDLGDSLNYTATLSDDNELPSWLTFNASARNFSGTPTN